MSECNLAPQVSVIIAIGTEDLKLTSSLEKLVTGGAGWEIFLAGSGATAQGGLPGAIEPVTGIGNAIDRARGKYVVMLNHADLERTGDLACGIAAMESHPGLVAIVPPLGELAPGTIHPGEDVWIALEPSQGLPKSLLAGILFLREPLQAAGPWETRIDTIHDCYQLLAEACARGEVMIGPEPLGSLTDAPAAPPLLPPAPDHTHARDWLFRATAPNAAEFSPSPAREGAVRVSIIASRTADPWDIQLNLPRLAFEKDTAYRVRFEARADQPRRMFVGAAMAHDPWLGMGLYQAIELTGDWQTYTAEFTAGIADDDARVHFDVGASDSSVEIASVAVCFGDGRPVPSGIQWGSLRRLTPVSRSWGFGRGVPVDRYYIERFLAAHELDIRGRVLEIEDNTYTLRFGTDRVRQSDILHVAEGNPRATLIGDLTYAPHIPDDSFDCIILTQTLQLIFDVPAAIRTLARVLKPDGVLLATFPGISQTKDTNWTGGWYWAFTPDSARRLFQCAFPHGVAVETFGNVLSGVALLHGISATEISQGELDSYDPGYDVIIGVRAVKPRPAATPFRQTRSAKTAAKDRALVLMYHRVERVPQDPSSLAVAPSRFAEQLEVICSEANPVPLRSLVSHLLSGSLPERCVAITFDDGYVDNAHKALPLLESRQVAATLFVTTGPIGTVREFWWDDLERILLGEQSLPERLRLTLNGMVHEWSLPDAETRSATEHRVARHWKASDAPMGARQSLYLELWRILQPMRDTCRMAVLDELAAWSGAGGSLPSYRPLRAGELVSMAAGPLIEFGAHSRTHPPLAALPELEQEIEIRQSRAELEEILGRTVAGFAYPYGSMSAATARLVEDSGFAFACSTNADGISLSTNRYRLPRLQVRDWHGEQFSGYLNRWFQGNFEVRCLG